MKQVWMKLLVGISLFVTVVFGASSHFVNVSGDEVDTPGINTNDPVVLYADSEDPGRGGIGYIVPTISTTTEDEDVG